MFQQHPPRRFEYPRFVGGKLGKRTRVPQTPPDQQALYVPRTPLVPVCIGENDTASRQASVSFETLVFHRHKFAFGSGRILSFWADSSLTGEEAGEALIDAMFSRLGVREVTR